LPFSLILESLSCKDQETTHNLPKSSSVRRKNHLYSQYLLLLELILPIARITNLCWCLSVYYHLS